MLASVPLLGHLPATAILNAGGFDGETLGKLASGELRAAYVPARPGDDVDPAWTVRAAQRQGAAPQRRAVTRGEDGLATVNGTVAWVPDAVGADVLVVVGVENGSPVAVAFGPDAKGVSVEAATGVYDATRPLGHVTLDDACGQPLAASEERAATRVVPRARADRGGVARRGRGVPRALGRLREGALHVRARDRLLPGGQARVDRGAAPPGEHALAALLRRLGVRRTSRTSSPPPRAPRVRPAGRRWTSPRAR